MRKLDCVLAGLEWGELLVGQVLSWNQGQMITKALLGSEKTKETCCNKVFKPFCSGQLYWMLTYEVSCADVPGSWYSLYEGRSMIRLSVTCLRCYSCIENLLHNFYRIT